MVIFLIVHAVLALAFSVWIVLYVKEQSLRTRGIMKDETEKVKEMAVPLKKPRLARSWLCGEYMVSYKMMPIDEVITLILDHLELGVEELPARARAHKLVSSPRERIFAYDGGEEKVDGDA